MEKGTCDACGNTNTIIFLLSWYDGLVCMICYGNVRKLLGIDRRRKLRKIKANNTIKLTMWD